MSFETIEVSARGRNLEITKWCENSYYIRTEGSKPFCLEVRIPGELGSLPFADTHEWVVLALGFSGCGEDIIRPCVSNTSNSRSVRRALALFNFVENLFNEELSSLEIKVNSIVYEADK